MPNKKLVLLYNIFEKEGGCCGEGRGTYYEKSCSKWVLFRGDA